MAPGVTPRIHHKHSHPPFLLPLSLVLPTRRNLKPSNYASVSGVGNDAVNSIKLASAFVIPLLLAASLSIVLGKDVKFPRQEEGFMTPPPGVVLNPSRTPSLFLPRSQGSVALHLHVMLTAINNGPMTAHSL